MPKRKIKVIASQDQPFASLSPLNAFVGAKKWATKNQGKTVLIGLSGRGDKDMPTLSKVLNI